MAASMPTCACVYIITCIWDYRHEILICSSNFSYCGIDIHVQSDEMLEMGRRHNKFTLGWSPASVERASCLRAWVSAAAAIILASCPALRCKLLASRATYLQPVKHTGMLCNTNKVMHDTWVLCNTNKAR